jgi:hypothetical protein
MKNETCPKGNGKWRFLIFTALCLLPGLSVASAQTPAPAPRQPTIKVSLRARRLGTEFDVNALKVPVKRREGQSNRRDHTSGAAQVT